MDWNKTLISNEKETKNYLKKNLNILIFTIKNENYKILKMWNLFGQTCYFEMS